MSPVQSTRGQKHLKRLGILNFMMTRTPKYAETYVKTPSKICFYGQRNKKTLSDKYCAKCDKTTYCFEELVKNPHTIGIEVQM